MDGRMHGRTDSPKTKCLQGLKKQVVAVSVYTPVIRGNEKILTGNKRTD